MNDTLAPPPTRTASSVPRCRPTGVELSAFARQAVKGYYQVQGRT